MCAKRPSPRLKLPISPEDCTLLSDAMMLLFEDMSFDFAAHGLDYDHANAAYDRLYSGQTALTLLETQAVGVLVRQALVRLADASFRLPDLERSEPELLPSLRRRSARLTELSSLLAASGQPSRSI